jgi:hypothetical protein
MLLLPKRDGENCDRQLLHGEDPLPRVLSREECDGENGQRRYGSRVSTAKQLKNRKSKDEIKTAKIVATDSLKHRIGCLRWYQIKMKLKVLIYTVFFPKLVLHLSTNI